MSKKILRKRKVVVISQQLIRGVVTKERPVGHIHDVQVFTGREYDIWVSADKVTHEYTVEQMEEYIDIKLSEMDHIILHFQNGLTDVIEKFSKVVPGNKVTYAVCCEQEKAEEWVRIHHPGAFVIGVECGVDPVIGHIVRRFLNYSYRGSTHLTRA